MYRAITSLSKTLPTRRQVKLLTDDSVLFKASEYRRSCVARKDSTTQRKPWKPPPYCFFSSSQVMREMQIIRIPVFVEHKAVTVL